MNTRHPSEAGYALVATLAVLAVIGIVVMTVAAAATGGAKQAETSDSSQVSRTAAENGIEAARAELQKRRTPSLYDGGSGDSQWSYSRGGKTLSFGSDSTTTVSIRYVGDGVSTTEGEFEIKTSGKTQSGTTGETQTRLDASMFASMNNGVFIQAGDDTISVPYNGSKTYKVTGDDIGQDITFGQLLTEPDDAVAEVDCVRGGSNDGQCTAVAATGATGTTSFVYEAMDRYGNTDTATVTVTVDPTTVRNDPPEAVDDTDSVRAGDYRSVKVLANDTDRDADQLSVVSHTNPAKGIVSCSQTECVYTAEEGDSGTRTFTYTVSDGHGHTDTATVTISVILPETFEPPSPPVAVDDPHNQSTGGYLSTGYMQAKTIPVLSNDQYDADSVAFTNAAPSWGGGTVSCNVSTGCTVRPKADFSGITKFTYGIRDAVGTDTATVALKVGAKPVTNRAPVAYDNAYSPTESKPFTFNVIDDRNSGGYKDRDDDDDDLKLVDKTKPAKGTLACETWGKCTYTPAATDGGNTRTFTYRISDGHGGTDSATVTLRIAQKPPSQPTRPTCTTLNDNGQYSIDLAVSRTFGGGGGRSEAIMANGRVNADSASSLCRYDATQSANGLPYSNAQLEDWEQTAKRQGNYFNVRQSGTTELDIRANRVEAGTVVFITLGTSEYPASTPIKVKASITNINNLQTRAIIVSRGSTIE